MFTLYPSEPIDIKIWREFTTWQDQQKDIEDGREDAKTLLPKIQELLKDKEMAHILHTIFGLGSGYGIAGGTTMSKEEQEISKLVGESWLK